MQTAQPLASPLARRIALLLGGSLVGAGVFVPEYAGLLTAVGTVALFLGGLGMKPPAWAVVRPAVPLASVPVLLGLAQVLERAPELPLPESVKPWVGVASGFLGLLAGKVLPMPEAQSPKADEPPAG